MFRVIVDKGKYEALPSEQANLAAYLTGAGAQLHLSNPIFPRSFPKVILIDERYALIGSACLDTTTFAQYRDYAYVSDEPGIIKDLSRLFENDWLHSAKPGQSFPTYNPTPAITQPNLLVSPVNSAYRLVSLIQRAHTTLDVTSELLGDPTLESELAAAAAKGVRVRLIAPETVNGATPDMQELQVSSLSALKAAGIHVHVTRPPESPESPYMHARTAVADGRRAYLGSISLSPDSATYNREVGLILDDTHFVRNWRINLRWTSIRRASVTDSRARHEPSAAGGVTLRLRTPRARRGGVRSRALRVRAEAFDLADQRRELADNASPLRRLPPERGERLLALDGVLDDVRSEAVQTEADVDVVARPDGGPCHQGEGNVAEPAVRLRPRLAEPRKHFADSPRHVHLRRGRQAIVGDTHGSESARSSA